MNIGCCADTKYLQHCAVMLASLISYTDPRKIHFFLIADAIAPETLDKFTRFCTRTRVRLTILDVEPELPKVLGLKTIGHLTRTVWLRLLIPSLLPNEDKLLYLDADTILLSPVEELYAHDISGFAAGAVPDSIGWSCYEQLGLDSETQYFNSGVLLMNLDYFRKNNIAEKCIAFAIAHPELLKFADQCALNHVLKGHVLTLDYSWNHHPQWKEKSIGDLFSKPHVPQAGGPHLAHFVGSFKPWNYLAQIEYGDEYWRHLKSTEFSDYIPPDKTPVNMIKKALKLFIPERFRAAVRLTPRAGEPPESAASGSAAG